MKTLILLFSCFATIAGAQSDREMVHMKYSIAPIKDVGSHNALHEFDFNSKFPMVVKDHAMLAGGVGYETLWTNQNPLFGNRNIQGVSAQLLFNRSLKNENTLLTFVTGGVYSDFKDLSGEDIRYTIGVRYKTRLHEKFSLSYGLAFSKQFFGLMLAPFLDFDWKVNNRLRLSGPVPLNTRLRYNFSEKAELSFFLKPENATYRLSEEIYNSQYFQKKQWNLGLGFDYQLTRHWLFTVRSGYSLKRKLEIYDASQTGFLSILTYELKGQRRTPYYQYQGSAFFAEVMLAWVLGKE